MYLRMLLKNIHVLLSVVTLALAGSPCPPRQNIYPCRCEAVLQKKAHTFTSVSCHHLQSTDSLNFIFSALMSLSIDRLNIYDSFWEADKLGAQDKQVLPTDWITLLKVKEFEIVDTTLSPSFACNIKRSCKNSITTRFAVFNSSSHDTIDTICELSSAAKTSWTGCMQNLEKFHFRHGKLTTIHEIFPLPMSKLTELDLSYNQITRINNATFQKTSRVKVLNLSHNLLQTLDFMSLGPLKELQQLDVSWNKIRTLGVKLFLISPNLKIFKANDNYILNLNETEWKNDTTKLKDVDITGNPVHCDCSIRFVNGTFLARKVNFQGTCSTPREYEGSHIRKISSVFIKLCDKDKDRRKKN